MKLKQLMDEDFVNYKKPSMFIGFSTCTWKCEKECGVRVCQNGDLALSPTIEYDVSELVKRYDDNEISKSVVCGGLEPMDDFENLIELIKELRKVTDDDVVIYSGYNKDELEYKISQLLNYSNIIIKFGRYVPNSDSIFDDLLGVMLSSNNQYAERIS